MTSEYERLTGEFTAAYRRSVKRQRARSLLALSAGIVLGQLGWMLGYGIQHHVTGIIVSSIIGMVGVLVTYGLHWYASALDRVGRINFSPILDGSGGEEGGGGDVEPIR